MSNGDDHTKIALIAKDVEYIKKEVSEISSLLASSYVSKTEFEPVKKVVYGLVSLILVAVVGAVVALVVQS